MRRGIRDLTLLVPSLTRGEPADDVPIGILRIVQQPWEAPPEEAYHQEVAGQVDLAAKRD
jgi:hypothetical protein